MSENDIFWKKMANHPFIDQMAARFVLKLVDNIKEQVIMKMKARGEDWEQILLNEKVIGFFLNLIERILDGIFGTSKGENRKELMAMIKKALDPAYHSSLVNGAVNRLIDASSAQAELVQDSMEMAVLNAMSNIDINIKVTLTPKIEGEKLNGNGV